MTQCLIRIICIYWCIHEVKQVILRYKICWLVPLPPHTAINKATATDSSQPIFQSHLLPFQKLFRYSILLTLTHVLVIEEVAQLALRTAGFGYGFCAIGGR